MAAETLAGFPARFVGTGFGHRLEPIRCRMTSVILDGREVTGLLATALLPKMLYGASQNGHLPQSGGES
jgi:hypothetical protein